MIDREGQLAVPDGARGLVIFAHGGGSSRFSPRNRYVARVLQEIGLATLLFDLLTPDEEEREVGGGICDSTSHFWPTRGGRAGGGGSFRGDDWRGGLTAHRRQL